LEPLYPASKGKTAWPPLEKFKTLLLAVSHDLSDVKVAEALEDCASSILCLGERIANFRGSCGTWLA
jgi:hypothetical protein